MVREQLVDMPTSFLIEYCPGGTGSNGGGGGTNGGAGGAGQGSHVAYEFNAQTLAVNNHDINIHDSTISTFSGNIPMIQNHRSDGLPLRHSADRFLELNGGRPEPNRESSGLTRNLRHQKRLRPAPYDNTTRPRRSVTGFNSGTPTSGSHRSFPWEPKPNTSSSQYINRSTVNVISGNKAPTI
ncbi:hypothetical protein B0H12DRAFT_1082760 [Mycena haematopus]|nr:hypothetical protein B0H12DRAFT_1082760 [Mycena haematopus]